MPSRASGASRSITAWPTTRSTTWTPYTPRHVSTCVTSPDNNTSCEAVSNRRDLRYDNAALSSPRAHAGSSTRTPRGRGGSTGGVGARKAPVLTSNPLQSQQMPDATPTTTSKPNDRVFRRFVGLLGPYRTPILFGIVLQVLS